MKSRSRKFHHNRLQTLWHTFDHRSAVVPDRILWQVHRAFSHTLLRIWQHVRQSHHTLQHRFVLHRAPGWTQPYTRRQQKFQQKMHDKNLLYSRVS